MPRPQTMHIRITRGTVAGGGVVEPGQVLDVTPGEAALLIRLKKAVAVPEAGPALTHGDPTVQHGDPAPGHADPHPAPPSRRRR